MDLSATIFPFKSTPGTDGAAYLHHPTLHPFPLSSFGQVRNFFHTHNDVLSVQVIMKVPNMIASNLKVLLVGSLVRLFLFYYYHISRFDGPISSGDNLAMYHWSLKYLLAGPGKDTQSISQCMHVHIHSHSPQDILPLSSSLFCESLSHVLTAASPILPSTVIGDMVSALSNHNYLFMISFVLQFIATLLLISLEDEHICANNHRNDGNTGGDGDAAAAAAVDDDDDTVENDGVKQLSFAFASSTYWLNPANVFGTLISPFPFLVHMLILVAFRCAVESRKHGGRKYPLGILYVFVVCLVSALLTYISPQFVVLIPALVVLMCRGDGEYFNMTRFTYTIGALATFIGWSLICFEVKSPTEFLRKDMYGLDAHSYSPTLSLNWYLYMQIFEDTSDLYVRLLYSQPFMFVVPLLIRLYSRSLEVLYILIGIVFMYKSNTTVPDVIFVLSCLMLNFNQVFMHIKNLLPLLFFIIIPLVLSPTMLYLWVDKGTANANYFFFQTLIMWSSYTMLIIQYTRVIATSTTLAATAKQSQN